MTEASNIEIGMLTAALQSAVAYRDQYPQDLKNAASVLMDWAVADEAARRKIYSAWRNKDNGAASSETF